MPTPGDPTNVEAVALPAKPAAIATGTSTWDQAFDNLKGAFSRIEDTLSRAGIAPRASRSRCSSIPTIRVFATTR